MPRFSTKILLALFATFLTDCASLEAQHPSWHNYTTTDGLPSNEIYGMLQDSRGFIWFTTDLGICRFNGYEFHRPVDTSLAAISSTFKLAEDAQGRIWFNHLDATLSIIENDTVRPWSHNGLLKLFQGGFTSFESFSIEKNGTIWLPLLNLGFLHIRPDGSHWFIPGTDRNVFIFTEVEGKTVYSTQKSKNKAEIQFRQHINISPEILRWEYEKRTSLGRLPDSQGSEKKNQRFEAKILKNGDVLIHYAQTFYLFRNRELIWHGQKEIESNYIYEDEDGSILLACIFGKNRGLLRFRSMQHFQRDSFDNMLPRHNVVGVLRDQEGGLWASTTDAGVFYCKNTTLDILEVSDVLPSNNVTRLATDGRQIVYAALQTPDICSIDRQSGRMKSLPSLDITGNPEIKVLYFDTLTRRLWCGPILSFLDKKGWTIIKEFIFGSIAYNTIYIKKIAPEPSGRRWWANSSSDFFLIDPIEGTVIKIIRKTTKQIFAVTPDFDGKLWATLPEGLRLWRDGHFELPPFKHPALRFSARNVELLPPASGGGIIIILDGGGVLIRDVVSLFINLTTKDGLTSNVLSEIRIARDGKIYACSNAGLNILTPQSDGKWGIETVTVKHGLPSNQVNDVVLLNDEIWVATDKGIARFRGKPNPAPMPCPILEKFVVNNHLLVFSENLQLAHDQNNLSLRFFALHFRSSGDIPYRYRLLGSDTTFVFTRTREVNFANLATGKYTFEVQAQNEDGQWSESSKWAFAILPPWWASWWFRTLVASALAATAYLFYQNRLQSIRREAAEREKIRDLETAALRAQMNPHFIFNCLQAIQMFIAQNDRDAAATYLARFAKLVRLALHGSVDGLHSLADEIAMLENYLYLEQLRFRGKFEFSVRAAEGLDPVNISFPPLLVQPFVENALLHGLEDRTDGGLVEVVFAAKGKFLEVSVTDNGQGFSEKKTPEKRPHKSVGMMLTQNRLGLLMGSGKADAEYLVRETILDEQGNPVGARVQILIPI